MIVGPFPVHLEVGGPPVWTQRSGFAAQRSPSGRPAGQPSDGAADPGSGADRGSGQAQIWLVVPFTEPT